MSRILSFIIYALAMMAYEAFGLLPLLQVILIMLVAFAVFYPFSLLLARRQSKKNPEINFSEFFIEKLKRDIPI